MKSTLRASVALITLITGALITGCTWGPQAAAGVQEKVLNFANDQRLDEHWRKHGLNASEFKPPLSKQQYLEAARAFFAKKAEDIETKTSRDGDTLRYRISTNEFGVLSNRNVIRTYFRPDSGIRYWRRQ